MIGYSEPVMKRVGSGRALSRVSCNVVRVAARFGYTSDNGFESRGRVRQCRECGQATRSSLRLECEGEVLC